MNLFELGILDFIQQHLRTPALDFFFSSVTHLGDAGICCIVLAVILLLFKKTRKAGVTLAIAMILGALAGNLLLKNLIARTRPYDLNTAIRLLIKKSSERYSFPSGHTLVWTETALCIFFYSKKWGIAAFAVALTVAFSRLYLYAHYPSDIVYRLFKIREKRSHAFQIGRRSRAFD